MYLLAFSIFNWCLVKSLEKSENPWLTMLALFLCLINIGWAVLLAVSSFHMPHFYIPVHIVKEY